jgi:hypothetical protein
MNSIISSWPSVVRKFAVTAVLILPAFQCLAAERHALIVFGSQDPLNTPRKSHTWATMVTIEDSGNIREETISWMPAPGYFGPGMTMPPLAVVPGRNYTLDETLAIVRPYSIRIFGSFDVNAGLYHRFVARKNELEDGRYRYSMLANGTGNAANCIHAVAGLKGFLATGRLRGFSASAAVTNYFSGEFINRHRLIDDISQLIHLRERIANR